jgi:hypothetical protein
MAVTLEDSGGLMYKSLVGAIFSLFFLFPAIVPEYFQAHSQTADVNVKNFPETQHITGDVHVTNFPDLQQIRGSVSVEGTTKSIKREGLVVPISRRAELSEMVHAGTIETDGFTSILINLQGEVRSDSFSSGTIGVLLVPDEKPVLRALRDAKRLQFPIECAVQTKSGGPVYFESEQAQQRIAFSRYQLYLYNTSNKSVEANVYFYLSR